MRHEALSTLAQMLAAEYLQKFGGESKKILEGKWYNAYEHFDSAIHDASIELARQVIKDKSKPTFGLFHCIATRRIIDMMRQDGTLRQRHGQDLRPKTDSLDFILSNRYAQERDVTLADLILIDPKNQFRELELIELVEKIRLYLEEQRNNNQRWADTALGYFFDGMTYEQIQKSKGRTTNAITKDLWAAENILKKTFAASL